MRNRLFPTGRTINQFQRLCPPSTHFLSSIEDSEHTCNSINSLNTNEDVDALDEFPDDVDAIIDDDEDNLICEININAANYWLCKSKAAHDAVLGKTDASLVKRTLTVMEALHLDTNP